MAHELLVSVVIPTYNRAEYVAKAVDSVLAQTYSNIEVIVVNDGSNDNTEEVLASYGNKIRHIVQDNAGVSAARNTGIRGAIGDCLAFLDSDDLWVSDKIQKQVDLLVKNPKSCGIYSNVVFVDEAGCIVSGGYTPQELGAEGLFKNILVGKGKCRLQTLLVRKECLEDIGEFDATLKHGWEDRDFILRLSAMHRLLSIDEPLTKIVMHSGTHRHQAMSPVQCAHDYFSILDKIFLMKMDIPHDLKNKALSQGHFVVGKSYMQNGDFKNASSELITSLSKDPTKLQALYLYLACILAQKAPSLFSFLRSLLSSRSVTKGQ